MLACGMCRAVVAQASHSTATTVLQPSLLKSCRLCSTHANLVCGHADICLHRADLLHVGSTCVRCILPWGLSACLCSRVGACSPLSRLTQKREVSKSELVFRLHLRRQGVLTSQLSHKTAMLVASQLQAGSAQAGGHHLQPAVQQHCGSEAGGSRGIGHTEGPAPPSG